MPRIGEIKKAREIGRRDNRPSRKYIHAMCPNCKKERWVIFRSYHHKDSQGLIKCQSCFIRELDARHKMQDSPAWRGGRHKHNGYIFIKLDPNDFFYPMADHKGYVQEHRLVMAKHLHRCLLPWEIVHHKNGIRDANRLENLMLLPSSTHHLPDKLTKARLTKLENKVQQQANQIRLLQWHIRELERSNFLLGSREEGK